MASGQSPSAQRGSGILPPGAVHQRQGIDWGNVNHKAETTVKALIRKEVISATWYRQPAHLLQVQKAHQQAEDEGYGRGHAWFIISREVWDTVVSIDEKKVRKSPTSDGIKSIFTGIVHCADCGFKMRNHVEKFTYKDGRPGRYSSFICGNYARSGKSACTIHMVYENVLEQLVLADIREKARFAEYDGERLVEQITRLKEKESRSRLYSCERELKAATSRVNELEKLMQNLYEDKCKGTIPQTVFQTLMRKYGRSELKRPRPSRSLRKVKAQLENKQDAGRWTAIIRRYTEITGLDETILFELVDRIEVGDTQIVNGQRICDIRVFYRYVGNVDDALV